MALNRSTSTDTAPLDARTVRAVYTACRVEYVMDAMTVLDATARRCGMTVLAVIDALALDDGVDGAWIR